MPDIAQYALPAIFGFLVPFLALVIGIYVMRGSGMLPAQARLDAILKTTIDAMQGRIETLEKDLHESQGKNQDALDRITALENQHQAAIREKDDSLTALQRALIKEQQVADKLRLQVAENEAKIETLIRKVETRQ